MQQSPESQPASPWALEFTALSDWQPALLPPRPASRLSRTGKLWSTGTPTSGIAQQAGRQPPSRDRLPAVTSFSRLSQGDSTHDTNHVSCRRLADLHCRRPQVTFLRPSTASAVVARRIRASRAAVRNSSPTSVTHDTIQTYRYVLRTWSHLRHSASRREPSASGCQSAQQHRPGSTSYHKTFSPPAIDNYTPSPVAGVVATKHTIPP